MNFLLIYYTWIIVHQTFFEESEVIIIGTSLIVLLKFNLIRVHIRRKNSFNYIFISFNNACSALYGENSVLIEIP